MFQTLKGKTYHFSDGSLPGDGLLQLKQTQAELRSAAAAVQSLPPCAHSRGDLTFKAARGKKECLYFWFKHRNSSHAHSLSPDDVHQVLLSRRGGERGEAHHLRRVPERLLQVAPLDVSLQVGETQHSQVQRVGGNAREAGPLLLGSYDPVVSRVHIVFVVLKVLTRRVWVGDGERLQGDKDVKRLANL